MIVKRLSVAALALVLTPAAFAGAAQAHCHHGHRRHAHAAAYRLDGTPRPVVRSSFVERREVYGAPFRPMYGASFRPVTLHTYAPLPAYGRPEIGADAAIVVARRHGLVKLKKAEHDGGHWNVNGWAWDGRWVEAQVYGDGRLKRIEFERW